MGAIKGSQQIISTQMIITTGFLLHWVLQLCMVLPHDYSSTQPRGDALSFGRSGRHSLVPQYVGKVRYRTTSDP
jgi:hypothetical protein